MAASNQQHNTDPVSLQPVEGPANASPGRAPLSQRTIPTQQRGKDTVEQILTCAAKLADEVGVDAFNTNLLAERADIRIRTIYRYFPNKHAVLAAAVVKLYSEYNALLCHLEPIGDPARDWHEPLHAWMAACRQWIRDREGSVLVSSGMLGIPDVADLLAKLDRETARDIATILRRRGLDRPDEQIFAIGRSLIEVNYALLHLSIMSEGGDAEAMLDELQTMMLGYLGSYLDPS